MTRTEILTHADNLYKSLQEEKFKTSRRWLLKMQKEIERLSRFIFDMDALMGHQNWEIKLVIIL